MHAKFFYGIRQALEPGQHVAPVDGYIYFSPNLDDAIWAAELTDGDDAPRVYEVAITGPTENAVGQADYTAPPHPAMSWRSPRPITILGEVTKWPRYHGTRADLRSGDLIKPGHLSNFGAKPRLANFVYFAGTLDAAIWGAELAAGKARERIYLVEPTGEFEDDPNVTNMRFKGNPTKSFRSRAPLRVTAELESWVGHDPESVRAMRDSVKRLEEQGIEADD